MAAPKPGSLHVCPYCSTAYRTRNELVDHLTRLPGCLKRAAQQPRGVIW